MEAPIVIQSTNDVNEVMDVEKMVFGQEALSKYQLGACQLMVASVCGTVVGYIATSVNTLDNSLCIESIAVISDWQNYGIGSRFLDIIITHCYQKDIHKIVLYTRVDNERAIKLYKSKGFTTTSTHKDYYGYYNPLEKKGDAYVMNRFIH